MSPEKDADLSPKSYFVTTILQPIRHIASHISVKVTNAYRWICFTGSKTRALKRTADDYSASKLLSSNFGISCRRPRWAANVLQSLEPSSFVWCSLRTVCCPSTVCTPWRRTLINGIWPRRWWACWWKHPSPSTRNVDKNGNGQSDFKTLERCAASLAPEIFWRI